MGLSKYMFIERKTPIKSKLKQKQMGVRKDHGIVGKGRQKKHRYTIHLPTYIEFHRKRKK